MMERTDPAERAAWHGHFRRHPPGDYLTQTLLAQVCAILVRTAGGDAVHPREFAPWLHWPERPAPEPQGPAGTEYEDAVLEAMADRMGEG